MNIGHIEASIVLIDFPNVRNPYSILMNER